MKMGIFERLSRIFRCEACNRHTEEASKGIKEIADTEGYEYCVMCGDLTDVPMARPVDCRENYIVGCGQLCPKCARKQRKL